MLTITFNSTPYKQRGLWWITTGGDWPSRQFATKREAAEHVASLGRASTLCARELNDAYRRCSSEGQGFVTAMTPEEIAAWNLAKRDFDDCLLYVARRQAAPAYIIARLRKMGAAIKEMAVIVGRMPKAKYHGAEISLQACTKQAAAALASLEEAGRAGAIEQAQAPKKKKTA